MGADLCEHSEGADHVVIWSDMVISAASVIMSRLRKQRDCIQASYLCTLLLLISSATPSSSNTEKARSGSLGQQRHKRLARGPQTFGNSFDPIPADEVREHFAAGTGARDITEPTRARPVSSLFSEISCQSQRKSTPVRFPDPRDEDQLLLKVQPFPEESLATKQDPVLTDFLRIEPKRKQTARPRTLKESFASIGQELHKQRLHLPVQRDSTRKIGLPKTSFRNENVFSFQNESPRTSSVIINAQESDRKTAIRHKARESITNPLLQQLFNKNSIPSADQTAFQNPRVPFADNIQQIAAPVSLFQQIKSKISAGQQESQVTPDSGDEDNFIAGANNKISQSALSQGQIFTEQRRLREQILEQQKQEQASKRKQLEEIEKRKKKEKSLMDALLQQRVKEELDRRQKEERLKEEQERKRVLEIRQEETRRVLFNQEKEAQEREKTRIEEEMERLELLKLNSKPINSNKKIEVDQE